MFSLSSASHVHLKCEQISNGCLSNNILCIHSSSVISLTENVVATVESDVVIPLITCEIIAIDIVIAL